MTEQKPLFVYGVNQHGSGTPIMCWSQDFSMIAVCGQQTKNLYILDKRGKKLKETSLNSNNAVLNIDWDKDNEMVVVLQENMNSVFIWSYNQNKVEVMELDNAKAKASFVSWSKTHPVLAVGTDKGSLLFYNKRNQKKIPTMGKHSKKIISGDWNQDGLLITAGEDKIMTISNYASDTQLESMSTKFEPKNLQWCKQKTDNRNEKINTICSIMQQKTLLMMDVVNRQNPMELVFESKYGKIIDYSLFGDGYIVLGFSEGYVVHISTHMKELQNEVQSEKIFNSSLDAIATNDFLYKLAVAGEGQIKFYSLSNWKEIKNEKIILSKQIGKIISLKWSNNGQLLVATTSNGNVIGYTTSVPYIFSEYKQFSAIMSSFTQIDIYNMKDPKLNQISKVEFDFEPKQISLCQNVIGMASGIYVYYYSWAYNQQSQLISKKEFSSQIKKIQVNQNYSCVLLDSGKLICHSIRNQQFEKKFPENQYDKQLIQQFTLTSNFLIYIDGNNKLKFYNIQDQAMIMDFTKDEILMSRLYSNINGTKIIIIDNNNQGYLFNSREETLTLIENWPSQTLRVIWDAEDSNLFCAIQDEKLFPFIITQSLKGVKAQPVPEIISTKDQDYTQSITQIDRSIKPLQLLNGYLFYLTQSGTLQAQPLNSHSHIQDWTQYSSQEHNLRYFFQNISLNKLNHCLMVSQSINDPAIFNYLGKKALENLNIQVAQAAYQSAKNLSIVMALNQFKSVTEKNIIYGHIAMMLGKYDQAQELFLKSTKPQFALDMRCDIQDWITALRLAKQIDPKQEPLICKRLAILLESQGNFPEAQRLYEKSFLQNDDDVLTPSQIEVHNTQCFGGISRTAIKLGDISRGFSIAQELQDNQLVIDIAMVCENMKQHLEAAQLYEKSGLSEKAAALYIQLKMFKQVIPLIKKIKSPKLLIQLAKAKEAEQNFSEAEQAFEQAEDWENVIRLNLNQLKDSDKAKWVVRNKCQTAACSSLVSNYCVKQGEHKEAVEFLLLAGKKEEAFLLAQSYDEIQTYTDGLKDMSPQESLQVAQYFEGKSMWAEAAKYYEKYGNQARALKLYKQAGEEYIETMIEMVGRAKKDNLTNSLLDYLMGEDEYGEPKDPIYTYRVYKILKLFKQAAKISITISNQEQESGDYKAAHQMLYETFKDMKANNIRIPVEISNKLMILHSYIIVKRIVKQGDHEAASWLLNRVCKNISQFQQHAVNILTTMVIEATKANLKELAYNWACVLVRPEYRQNITEKFKSKIEAIARKAVTLQNEIQKSPCPFCQELVGEYDLDCQMCQNTIPYCIASGKHIVKDQCVFCNNCGFPSNLESLQTALQLENSCPMCYSQVEFDNLMIEANVVDQLRQWIKIGNDDDKQ